ncbi:cytochrome P450, partial [Plectosphaerella cucumerina]
LALLYHVLLAVYNVTLHPLARIPGPKLAGMTDLYQMFWCYHNGRSIYYRKIKEMHDQFGPVVRISPHEVSLQDPEDCLKIYAAHSNYSKDTAFYQTMGIEHGMFGSRDNVQHRRLRAPWQPFFSHKAISKLDGMIQSKVDLLCTQLELQLRQKDAASIQHLLHSLSSDIVSHASAVDGSLRALDDEFQDVRHHSLVEIMAATHLPRKTLAPSIITRDVLVDELHSFTVAGSFNTGSIGATTLFYILTNGDIHRRVMQELDSLQGNITHARVEKLPYMAACIKEGLRLGYGPIGRLPRVVPEPGAIFQGHRIPAGYTVGASSYVQHHNPDIWGEDHASFNPDRWLDPARDKRLGRHLLTFGKDSRRCIGQR